MNPIETQPLLPEKLEKIKLKVEENSDDSSDSNDSVTSEEEDEEEDYSQGGYSSDYNSMVSEEDDDDDYDDSDDSDSDDSSFSEDDDEKEPDATRLLLREQSKQIASDFLQQVQDNRFSDFSWPPDPNCPEYDYISHYIGDVVFEEDSEVARRYLDQVRTSWGYEVDCIPPQWMQPILYPVDLQRCCYQTPKQTSECVIDSINAEVKEYVGKRFEVVSVNKIVRARRELYLLTLTIKDAETNAEKTVRAAVSLPPPCKDPILVECKLVPSVPSA